MEEVKKFQKKTIRDENGLLKNLDHVFLENGFVDWKAMIPREHFVVNDGFFIKKGEEAPKDVSEIKEDSGLLILLSGFKELARIRGISERKNRVTESSGERVVVECEVTFIPNFETDFCFYSYSEVASATLNNVSGDVGMLHLETIAANRAFCRAIRNALRIDVLSEEEVSRSDHRSSQSPSSGEASACGNQPYEVLADKAKTKGFKDFDSLKIKLLEKNKNDEFGYSKIKDLTKEIVDSWTDWKSIENNFVYKLLQLLNSKK
jgi:hypothetical protein